MGAIISSIYRDLRGAFIKFYVYISDAKVDVLYPQVPHDVKKKVAIELKTDLKVFSASRKTETDSEESRIARLESVVAFIGEYGDIGTTDDPGTYFADTLEMRWGPYRGTMGTEIAYFGGETSKTVLGLGGSMGHLVGGASSPAGGGTSLAPFLFKALSGEIKLPSIECHSNLLLQQDTDKYPARGIQLANLDMQGPTQKLEFLAKRLQRWPDMPPYPSSGGSPKFVLLGSPLYVAMVD